MIDEQMRRIEQECMRLATAFAVYLDAGRYDEVVALFTQDARYRPRDAVYVGQAGVMSYLRARPAHRRSRHVISNLLIDVVNEKEAHGSCVLTYYVDESGLPADRPAPLRGPHLVGDYTDKFVLTPAGWRIAERLGHVLFITGQE